MRKTLLLACGLAVAGCAQNPPATQPTMRDRQDALLRDPFGYDIDNPSANPHGDRVGPGQRADGKYNVTGSGTKEENRKSLKRDLDHFWLKD